MPQSRFTKVSIPRVSGRGLSGDVVTKLAGLDMVTPVDEMAEGRTPEAKNFRLYDESVAGREVAVTTRKGPGFYLEPLTTTLTASNTSTTGASTAQVGVQTGTHVQPFTPSTSGRLSKLEVSAGNGNATAIMRVDVYSDTDGAPDKLLTSSSFLDMPDTPTYTTARFVNAVELTAGTQYWFAVYLQDDGAGESVVTTTTDGTHAWAGVGLLGAVATTYSLLYRVYVTPSQEVLGSYRFNRENTVNRTLVAVGTTMYYVDETTHTLKTLIEGLSSEASYYDFTNGDGKVFWVNGYDDVMAWNGTPESEADNMQTNGTFEVNTSGWFVTGGGSGAAVTRVTTDKNSGVASMNVTATSGLRTARTTVALLKNHRYKFTYYVKGTGGDVSMYAYGPNITIPGSTVTLNGSWQKVEFYYTPSVSTITDVGIQSTTANFLLDDVTFVDTGIEYIINVNLPKLYLIGFHKDRLFGVPQGDRNRLVFSENPGNPSNATEQWYYAWLSVSFIYVPRPKNGSPITAIIPFQDNLIIFTQDKKYVLSGTDRGNYFLREANGSEGALSPWGVTTDANLIYFVSENGIFSHNGSKDDNLSALIKPLFDRCPDKWGITLSTWDNTLRAYMNSEFSSVKDITAIFSTLYGEWMLDTDTFVGSSLYYDDADDQMELIEFSSQIPVAYQAEQDYNSLGAPIDFDYRLRYDSRGIPGQRKKFKRYVPLVQSVGRSFPITYGVDKNFEDSPREKEQQLNVGGAKIGEFSLDDGTILTGSTAFKPKKTAISGYSHYMQFRVRRRAVNNQVAFMGVQFTYKAKRL